MGARSACHCKSKNPPRKLAKDRRIINCHLVAIRIVAFRPRKFAGTVDDGTAGGVVQEVAATFAERKATLISAVVLKLVSDPPKTGG